MNEYVLVTILGIIAHIVFIATVLCGGLLILNVLLYKVGM